MIVSTPLGYLKRCVSARSEDDSNALRERGVEQFHNTEMSVEFLSRDNEVGAKSGRKQVGLQSPYIGGRNDEQLSVFDVRGHFLFPEKCKQKRGHRFTRNVDNAVIIVGHSEESSFHDLGSLCVEDRVLNFSDSRSEFRELRELVL